MMICTGANDIIKMLGLNYVIIEVPNENKLQKIVDNVTRERDVKAAI